MKSNLFVKSILGAIVLSLITLAFTEFTGGSYNLRYYLWSIPANFLVAFVLGYYIVNSRYSGLRLCSHVIIIFFIIGFFNIMIEALVFNVSDQGETIEALVGGLFLTVSFTPMYLYILGKWDNQALPMDFQPRSYFKWGWKISATVLLYFVMYLAAGMTLATVYPELLEFYEGKIPPFELIFQTQLLRGLIFAGIAILVLRTTNLSPIKVAFLIGGIYSILGGIAPLIPPNELMPLNIRIGHGFEVGISNFLFGMLASYLLRQNLVSGNSEPERLKSEVKQTSILQ